MYYDPGNTYHVMDDRSGTGFEFTTRQDEQMTGLMYQDLFQIFHD